MGGKLVRALFWFLTLVFFSYNLFLWGGLAVTPTYGKQLRDRSVPGSPLAATYLFIGRYAVNTAGKADEAMKFAAGRFPEPLTDTSSSPLTVVPRFLSAQSATGTLIYYGAPILLLLSVLLHIRRQKPIRSFGGQR